MAESVVRVLHRADTLDLPTLVYNMQINVHTLAFLSSYIFISQQYVVVNYVHLFENNKKLVTCVYMN